MCLGWYRGETMRNDDIHPVDEHLPSGEVAGCILVVSDYRPLNLAHASALCRAGFAVYTTVTCTDVARVFEQFAVDTVDLIAFASVVHGWHHQREEDRPDELPHATDDQWQVRNMRHVIDLVSARQAKAPVVSVASDLLVYKWYEVNAASLAAAGIDYQIYSASRPHELIGLLSG